MKRYIDEILKRASVKKAIFLDMRRTAISMWFANGMSEYNVMTLTGHSSIATTHKFYLAVANDLIRRARFGGWGYTLKAKRLYEELYKKTKRWTYKGKLTKKARKLKILEQRMSGILDS